jgi:hypothetical protein
MKNKLLLSSALVGTLVGGSAAVAQTTVTGSLQLNYYDVTRTGSVAGITAQSYRGWGRESQLNVQNKGKLNNGLDYAAGFSLEFDGNSDYSTTNVASNTESATISNENVYIDFIAGNTTFTIGVDHIQHSQTTISPSASGNIADNYDTRLGIYTNAIGANPKESIGMGLIQTTPFGKASIWYAPTASDNGGRDTRIISNKDGRNSAYEIGFIGDLGVKGLTAKAFYNNESKPELKTSTTSGAPGNGSPTRDFVGKSFGVAYNFGQVAVGADKSRTEFVDGISVDYKNYGVSYAVDKNLSISYNLAKASRSDKTTDEKIQQFGVGYNLGPVMSSIEYAKFESSVASTGPTLGNDAKVVLVKFGTNF